MKTGMNLLLWTDHVTEAQDGVIDELKAIGFDSVEVPVFNTDDLAGYERLGKRLAAVGLKATAVTVSTPEANPISPDPATRAAAVVRLNRVLECCQAFGCEVLCGPIHSALGHFSGAAPTDAEFQAAVEVIRQVADTAAQRNILLAVEYLNRFENYFLTTAADTFRFVKAVNHPSCRMMYDSFHAHIEEKTRPKQSRRAFRWWFMSTFPKTTEASPAPARSIGRAISARFAARAMPASIPSRHSAAPYPPWPRPPASGGTCSQTQWNFAARVWPSSKLTPVEEEWGVESGVWGVGYGEFSMEV